MKRLSLLLLSMLTVLATYACTASFSSTQSPSGNSLLRVAFTNSSSYGIPFTGQAKKATIRYGDGNSSTVWSTPLPAHTYASPGTYTAKLIIWNIDSTTMTTLCADSITIAVTVAYPSCGTVLSSSGTGATRNFTASNPAATTGISYSWNFGDGGTGTGSSPSHIYTTTGTYTVTCTSTVSSPACSYVNTIVVGVTVPAPLLNCSTLSANFSVSASSGVASVTNTSSTVSLPYATRVTWNWGDGTTSSGWSPSHAYAATGTYTIKLNMEWRDSLMSITHCRDSITKVVSITSLAPTTIHGDVYYDSSYGHPAIKVWLIRYNATTNMLSAADSQSISASAPKYYSFSNKPAGNYLVKAAVQGGATSGTGLVPTYHFSSATWSTATTVSATPGTINYAQIVMMNGTVSSGPGFVSGNVSLGANKGAAGGVKGMTILLRNSATQIISWATTDANGDFSIGNIPVGTYTVYPEAMNYATSAAAVTITSGFPNVGNVSFNQDDVKMNIAPRNLSVGGQGAKATTWSVYPNPASTKLTIAWKGLNGAGSGLRIVDIAGKTVLEQSFAGTTGTQTIDISTLRSGLYFMHGTGALNGSSEKLVVD